MKADGENARADLRALAKAIWRRKWLVVPIFLLIVGAAIALTYVEEKRYEASSIVLISTSEGQRLVEQASEGRLSYERDVANELQFLRSDEYRQRVLARLGDGPHPAFLVQAGEGDTFVFRASGTRPERVAVTVNAAAEEYLAERSDRVVDGYLEAIAAIQLQLAELDANERDLRAPLDELLTRDPFALDVNGDFILSDSESFELLRLQQLAEDEIASEMAAINLSRTSLQRTLDDLQVSSSLALSDNGSVSQRAEVPSSPVSPSWPTNLTLGVLGGLLASIGAAVALEFFNTKIVDDSDLHEIDARLPIVDFPKLALSRKQRAPSPLHLVVESRPMSVAADGVWQLHGQIQAVRSSVGGDDPFVVMVTSAEPGAGKSFAASNLATAMAMADVEVSLIDLDLRRPTIHRLFDLPIGDGIVGLIEGHDVKPEVTRPALDVMTAGASETNPSELIVGLHEVADERRYWNDREFLVVDTPPVLSAPDALLLLPIVDVVVLICRSRQTKSADVSEVIRRMRQQSGAQIVVVLNGVEERAAQYKYSYKS